ncbi:hypothetical protein BpHYR1_043875 [Brachionus plicatilis]|uniref:Uncharacterized protein n=1 Tax=Brachionus plicatilis TaxID=10195 RepID=A0A3M7QSN5_BRAPC|nr:hypothetical protein BpHYR1_043875 [Brachionus plicatilis]
MPHTNQMFEPITATISLLKKDRKIKNLIPESQSLSENEPLKELYQTEIQLPNISVVRKLRGVGLVCQYSVCKVILVDVVLSSRKPVYIY